MKQEGSNISCNSLPSIISTGNPELYDPTDTCGPTVGRHITDTCPNLQSELLNNHLGTSFLLMDGFEMSHSSIGFPYIC